MDEIRKSLAADPSLFKKIQASANMNRFTPIFERPKVESIPLIEHMEKTEDYQNASLKILQSIEENTANLYVLVELLNKSSENQDELIELASEILAISKAKTKEDADSYYRKVMGKINSSVKDAESMMKIVTWATSVYNMIRTMFPE